MLQYDSYLGEQSQSLKHTSYLENSNTHWMYTSKSFWKIS